MVEVHSAHKQGWNERTGLKILRVMLKVTSLCHASPMEGQTDNGQPDKHDTNMDQKSYKTDEKGEVIKGYAP